MYVIYIYIYREITDEKAERRKAIIPLSVGLPLTGQIYLLLFSFCGMLVTFLPGTMKEAQFKSHRGIAWHPIWWQ